MPEHAAALPLFAALPIPAPVAQTLLLVEDSRHAAEAVRLLARRLGLRLRRAETLAGARQHLRVYRPDMVVVDLGLPDGSGLELIAELARRQVQRLVAISADPDGRDAALAAGAEAFVTKPLRLPDDLGALFGPWAARLGAWLAPPDRSAGRNAGADPLALRDDLRRARAELARPGGRDYALDFLRGVARCSGDEGLRLAADRARASGQTAALLAELAAREAGARPF